MDDIDEIMPNGVRITVQGRPIPPEVHHLVGGIIKVLAEAEPHWGLDRAGPLSLKLDVEMVDGTAIVRGLTIR